MDGQGRQMLTAPKARHTSTMHRSKDIMSLVWFNFASGGWFLTGASS